MTRINAVTPTRGQAPSHSPPDMRYTPGSGAAHFLAWFSIGLGIVEVFAPRRLARWMGLRNQSWLFPLLGTREILTGAGMLNQDRVPYWLWGRVAGDVIDLALLGGAISSPCSRKSRVTAIAAAVLGITLLDVLCATQQTAAATLEG